MYLLLAYYVVLKLVYCVVRKLAYYVVRKLAYYANILIIKYLHSQKKPEIISQKDVKLMEIIISQYEKGIPKNPFNSITSNQSKGSSLTESLRIKHSGPGSIM